MDLIIKGEYGRSALSKLLDYTAEIYEVDIHFNRQFSSIIAREEKIDIVLGGEYTSEIRNEIESKCKYFNCEKSSYHNDFCDIHFYSHYT